MGSDFEGELRDRKDKMFFLSGKMNFVFNRNVVWLLVCGMFLWELKLVVVFIFLLYFVFRCRCGRGGELGKGGNGVNEEGVIGCFLFKLCKENGRIWED